MIREGSVMRKTNPLAIRLPPGTIIEGRFLFETLSLGRYSTVFKVEDKLNSDRKYCIKVEYDRGPKINYLHQEIAVLHKLETREHMARLYYCERCQPFSFMLTTLFGKSIWSLRQNLPNKLMSPGCAARIAVHTLYQIKQIHEVGYLLRDLKTCDMLVGLNGKETKVIFLVNFGMCRTYIRRDTNGSVAIRPEREKAFVRGILRYCSLRIHKRQDICRADDLWSLVYILIDLTVGLPWREIKVEKAVAEQKETISDANLFDNCPEEWIKIMEHVRSLGYQSRPNYKLIYDYLQETLVRFQISYSDPWDWDFVDNNVIIEVDSQQRTSPLHFKLKEIDQTGPEQTATQSDHSELSSKRERNENFTDSPKMQNGTETLPGQRNPFKEIIGALQSSFSSNSVLSTDQQSSTLPPSKQERSSAIEYDPEFPTTNPEEFEKNDIGI
uniref:Protein kinase domain-containing protein n=1 Tax=Elaeophora elaphi TaxID=1147741 RepID=A0A0R3RQR7_9BILA